MNTPSSEHQDVDRRLLALRSLGFQFVAKGDAGGLIVALIGFRAHHGVIDIVQLHGEHDADATRFSGGEPRFRAPRHTIWRATGFANDVLDRLLALADPVRAEWKYTG